jgi:hypothetical protein
MPVMAGARAVMLMQSLHRHQQAIAMPSEQPEQLVQLERGHQRAAQAVRGISSCMNIILPKNLGFFKKTWVSFNPLFEVKNGRNYTHFENVGRH